MSIATSALPSQRVLLHEIPWEVYERLRDEPENRHIRMTYDQGTLELMSPLSIHEWLRSLLGRFIETLTLELGIAVRTCGSTTFRRADLKRGLEPDECYYILNEPRVRGKDFLDLSIDPPPDLAIEVDITHLSYNRMPIYAALGVPELWRYDGDELSIYVLDSQRIYQLADASLNLPMLPPAEVKRFLELRGSFDETTLVHMFRDWVRETLVNFGE